MSDKKDWSSTAAANLRANPKAAANNQTATQGMLDKKGSLTNDPTYQAFKKNVPAKKEYSTTNAEEAKKLGITARQVSKMRSGRKHWQKD